MRAAVILLSPVIMTGRMPAALAVRMASAASGRGGSIMPARPRNVRAASGGPPSSGLYAMARTRSASSAMARFTASSSSRVRASSGRSSAPSLMRVHCSTITSGAPLQNTMRPRGPACTVVMRLVSDENGTSATRGNSRRRPSTSRPPLAASTARAISVGSPRTSPRPSPIVLSLHRALASRSIARAASDAGATWRSPHVKRPAVS